MPPESEPKTLSDDYIERVRNTFRQEFIRDVNNPFLLTDFLTCLEDIDREVVKAQQTQYGAIHAASILFDRIIKRPDWLDDLILALRKPEIGLAFLAERLSRFDSTIPARWDLSSFTDQYGSACFKGNCSDINMENLKVAVNEDVAPPSNAPQPEVTSQASKLMSSEDEGGNISVTEKYDDVDASGVVPRPILIEETKIDDLSLGQLSKEDLERKKEEIRLKRENLRLQSMEKVLSFIKKPEDMPVALHYMRLINIQIDKISNGSVILSIYISSLDALQQFEKLWRHGGLKRMLDKEMLGEDIMKALKTLAAANGHQVDNIRSELQVFETDIERCRSALTKSYFEFLPHSLAELSLAVGKTKATKETREIAVNAIELLPEELKSLLDDPFVFDRAHDFLESEPLKRRLQINHTAGPSQIRPVMPVARIFKDWLNSELHTYLVNIGDVNRQHLITLAVYLIESFYTDGTVAIPQEVLSENFFVEKSMMIFTQESAKDSTQKLDENHFWGDLIELPSEIVVDNATLQMACQRLMTENIIVKSRGHLNFYSNVVRDALISKVLLCGFNKGNMNTITGTFNYVQTLIGLFEMGSRYAVDKEAERKAAFFSFKTDELKEIGISGKHSLTVSSNSSFYSSDLIHCHTGEINMDANVIKAGEMIKKCQLKVKGKAQSSLVDLSVTLKSDESFILEDALHWLNATGNGNRVEFHTKGLSFDDCEVTDKEIESIGRYFHVSPTVYELSLRNCLGSCTGLGTALETGHFRNIRHLTISNNALFKKTSRPVGLMFITSLRNLDVQSCSLGDEGMKYLALDLAYMGHLRQLNISDNKLKATGLLSLTKALGYNKAVTALRIHKNNFGGDGVAILASLLESLILLEVLNISECGIGDKGSPLIASSLKSRSLRKLSIRKNNFSPSGSREFFRNFQRPTYLEHLDFSENKIFATSDTSSLSLAEELSPSAHEKPFLEFLHHLGPMNHLSLWNTHLGQKRIFKGLSNFHCFKEMTYLCLQENNISDEFVCDLCQWLSGCIYLEHFNVRQNHIGNTGAKCVAEVLADQRYLKEVLLDRNEIGDEGAEQVASVCHFMESFQLLDLSCNNISRKMIKCIVEDISAKADKIKIEQGSWDYAKTLFPRKITQRQGPLGENNFIITRDMDAIKITT